MELRVRVDDNFHYMDPTERWELGIFSTWEEAIAACEQIVDDNLASMYKPGMSSDELYRMYMMFGDDPFITGDVSDRSFSAWNYAQARCPMIAGDNLVSLTPLADQQS